MRIFVAVMIALLPATYAQAQCDAPTSVATGEVTTDGATISWDESATADSYTVSYRVHGDVDWTEAANSLTTTSYTFTGLVQGTSYDYRVQAVCGGGASAWTTSGESPFQVSFKPPLIKGAVFGGGRMANVEGKTTVEVKECQAIGSVFGGNDIAGEVEDADGATITLGTGSKTTPIIIGSVYGGGNGYYYYPSIGNVICNAEGTAASALAAGNVYGYWSGGSGTILATLTATTATTAPQVQKTLISVESDRVYIDSLFGGAKNAIISGDDSPTASDTTVSIRIKGGTVFSVFGGNNYGGFLADNTTQHIYVENTKALSPNSSVKLGGIHNTGVTHTGATIDAWAVDADAHAICYVFGGGNKVPGENVHIEVKGGQIDTCFGGGNSADVRTVLVDVNVTTPKYDLAHSPYTDATTYAYSPVTSVFDIRCLFGGNNAADMSGLPTLNLTRGGVHNVYGGGNRGIMKAGATYNDNYKVEADAGSTYTPSYASLNGGTNAKRSTKVFVNSSNFIADTIYGGGQSAGTDHDTYVEIANGNVGVVYGGTNIMGRIGPNWDNSNPLASKPRDVAKTNVYIHGGTIYNAVFGGSNGYYRCHNGAVYNSSSTNVLMAAKYDGTDGTPDLRGKPTPAVFKTYVLITGGTVLGNVFSSGNMASVGKSEAIGDPSRPDSAGIAILHITGGTIGAGNSSTGEITTLGSVYGGGNMGNVFGGTDLRISGSTTVVYGNVYGGNNKTGRVFATLRGVAGITELADKSTNAAVSVEHDDYPVLPGTITGSPDITANSQIALNESNASTFVLIKETPKIWGSLYGGGNGDYHYESDYLLAEAYSGDKEAVVNGCNMYEADQRSSFVDVNLTNGGYIAKVFGGGNSKTVGASSLGPGQATVYMNCVNTPVDNEENINVGSIFGGNNNVDMAKVPRIVLLRGKVEKVYGGGNLGKMTGNEPFYGLPLSTFVALPSNEIVITKDVYAGCNAADVTNHTYVKMRKGKVLGDIFGGNDAAGEVKIAHVLIDGEGANTRVDGSVYGGGNGNYAFYEYAGVDGEGLKYYTLDGVTYKAPATSEVNPGNYFIGTISGEAPSRTMNIQYHLVKGRPYVDSTDVVLKNNMVLHNVYGGGVSGDCRKTRVWVDAEDGVFTGMIFGAGKGRVDNMGVRISGGCKSLYRGVALSRNASTGVVTYGEANAMGNVLDTAFLTVSRFKEMRDGRSAMFGGGQSGHVGSTYVVYENTAVNKLKALYLGCLASDVKNSAIGIINAVEPADDEWIIDTIYGGNDFTGKVEHTYLTINSGTFTHVFGAGNGDVANTGVQYDNTRDVEYYKEWVERRTELSDEADVLARTTCNCYDTVPYSMDVNVLINGGNFLSNVYGGGNMGLVGDRDMTRAEMAGNETGRHSKIGNIVLTIHDGNFHRHVFAGARGKADMKSRFFDSWETTSPARADAKNVDNGIVGKQLAYAQKIVNMDGGFVHFSVYGGSEAVDDGFPYECGGVALSTINANIISTPGIANANTTLRPSSILNITGGRVEKSVYGGGYQGNIYGSVYVNIGIDAVRDCPVWDYTNTGFATSTCKPKLTGHSGYRMTNTYITDSESEYYQKIKKERVNVVWTAPEGNPTLQKAVVDLGASVYNASDWGEAGDKAYFNTRGVYGGVTNILLDGKGYYTSLTDPFNVDLPSMDIAYSIIGAGTSTDGGDVNKLITVRHYGDYYCPEPSKKLYSIQRADKVIMDSVFINLYGDQDAYSAYMSPSYSFCRIDTLIFRIDNIIMMESPSLYVGNLVSMKTDEIINIGEANQLYSKLPIAQDVIPQDGNIPAHDSNMPNDFLDNLPGQPVEDPDHPEQDPACSTSICESMTDICTKLPNARGESGSIGAFNVLMMRNGSYMKIVPFRDNNDDGVNDETQYGEVHGWMYLLAQDQTMSYVYAEPKTDTSDMTRGGFMAPCYCDNFHLFDKEMDYINVTSEGYRTWKVGTKQGSRVRHITLVANVVPDGRLNNNLSGTKSSLKTDEYGAEVADGNITVDASSDYAYATTILELPPADGGNFYVLNSVLIDQDNGGQMHLLEQGYDANNDIFFKTDNAADYNRILADPNYTFGLIFSSKENFDNENPCWGQITPSVTELNEGPFSRGLTYTVEGNTYRYPCWKQSVISGNRNLTLAGGYISNAIISGSIGAIPTMQFTLTYNKNLSTTINRDVIFTMYEFDKDGHYQGPVDVTVTISTVIKDFSDLQAPVLAMFNEGVTNEYVRKITIPAGFLQRDIYIEGIEWGKDNITEYDRNEGQGGLSPDIVTVRGDDRKADWFYMEEMGSEPPNNNNHFSIILKPTESSTENMNNNTLGWYHIEQSEGIDLFKMAEKDYEETTSGGTFVSSATDPRRVLYNSLNYDGNGNATNLAGRKGNGIWVGTLDGRATASIDIHLNFNGLFTYHKQLDPPLAWITLKCHYYNTKIEGDGSFDIKIKLRTRDYGDTIYLAPQPTLTRRPAEYVDLDGSGPNEPVLIQADNEITLEAYGYGYHGEEAPSVGATVPYSTPNYNNISNDKFNIKNDPRWYLTSFKQAMDIYDEGDVLCIMETMPIDGAQPISIMGDDYSFIQIIRYSGSHFSFPTLGCANRNTMIEVTGNGFLTMRNIWFNGSGCTRVKPPETGAWPNGGFSTTFTNAANSVTLYYHENHPREKVVLWSKAPIIYVHQGGEVALVRNIRMTNNFSNYDNIADAAATNKECGGAIALIKDEDDMEPAVTIGQYGNIYDNVVLDIAASNNYVSPYDNRLPRNYGGAVYVNGGRFTVGTGIKDTEIKIARNFYLKSNDENSAGIRTKTAYVFTSSDESSLTPIDFEVFYLDTINYSRYFSLSNVYLTRVPGEVQGCSNMIRKDKQSDLIYFLSEMTPDSRIGVSKWFPGYRYQNSGTLDILDNYDDTYHGIPRDTIAFARIGQGKSNTSLVDNNYTAGVFFNDSSYTAINGACASLGGGKTEPAFVTHQNLMAYSYAQTSPYSYNTPSNVYNNYKDKVYIYRHTSLAPYNIYFQRCATFGKGTHLVEEHTDVCWNGFGYKPGDSISYHWNSDATCALANDTIKFRVGGGFYPYTYSWSNITDENNPEALHTRRTTGSNAISTFGVSEYAVLRRKAEYDTLVFRLNLTSSAERESYTLKVTATDLTGNCPVEQEVKVDVAKVATDHHDNGLFYYDYENCLLHRKKGKIEGWQNMTEAELDAIRAAETANLPGVDGGDGSGELFYRIQAPGVDSSSFHDHADAVPAHDHTTRTVDATGGLCRAGYTHTEGCVEGHLDDFSGKPYAGDGNCTDGDMTPRYLRIFRSFKVKPSIYPVAARGEIMVKDLDGNDLYEIDDNHMSDDDWSPSIEVCPGEVLQFRPSTSTSSNWDFVGWDYDPSSPENANFVVSTSTELNNPIVNYAPGDYWWQVVTQFDNRDVNGDEHTATLKDYDLDYYGNVVIKTKKGLAWLISTVNGYNGMNAQTFHFNTITLDPTDGKPFDMEAHKWTPLGNANNPFEGVFDGNGKHVTNIIVNETTLPLVGMFGQTRGATIKNFYVDSTLVRGNTYVSAIVGEALDNTIVKDINIQQGSIFGEYTIGGFISHMVNSSLIGCKLSDPNDENNVVNQIGAFGNAIYAGGFLGLIEGVDTVRNNSAEKTYINISKLSAIYVGALIGYRKGATVVEKNKELNRAIVNNNYARVVTSPTSQRVGGLIGYAKDIDMNNNYVYGIADYDKNRGFVGGIAGFIDDNVSISNCYYVEGMAQNMVGYNNGMPPQKSTTFRGKGNNVILTHPVDGYTNMTRALNAWVRDHGDTIYNYWRSDFENVNSGYPIFGEPDIITVNDTLVTASCENFEFDGLTFDQSGIYVFHVVDSSDFVDSTLTLMLTINYGDTTQVSDTVNLGEGYEGHGFSLSAEELNSLNRNSRVREVYVLQFLDSLQNANGCDSLVVLTLYVINNGVDVPEVQKLTEVKVYPNPTRGVVNVEGSDLESIEVYDNISRRVLSRKVEGDRTTFDLSQQPAGSYYIRVRTANGTVVKKVIKK
ncbi:MAG: fibronectin type III domain-containing protein [Bacteroidales bacterium]|nr:fibronectin type III domain-containing protein [Bacteroidales bacterium]